MHLLKYYLGAFLFTLKKNLKNYGQIKPLATTKVQYP
jgi:hypothetical protein